MLNSVYIVLVLSMNLCIGRHAKQCVYSTSVVNESMYWLTDMLNSVYNIALVLSMNLCIGRHAKQCVYSTSVVNESMYWQTC